MLPPKRRQHLTGRQMPLEELKRGVDRRMDLVPSEDEGWDGEVQAYAEDAAAALAYAFRAAVTGDAQEAVWACQCAYNAMDHFAGRNETGSSYDEAARIRHPAVQAELSRQVRDIAELGQLDESDYVQTVERLRRRAEQEATSAFSE